MENKTHSVGDKIEARCTKCRKNGTHVIIVTTEGEPTKVQCLDCDREHKYRPPTAPRKAAVRRTVDPKVAEKKEWAELRPDMNADQAVTYSMSTAFKTGALIKHPVFGLGVVQRLVGPRKVDVLFEDGKKVMRCK